ncbi:MAG: diacylglycerol kinase family protein [Zavarzinella sp.]
MKWLLNRLRSFGHAFRGLGVMFRTQRNAWIHLLATIVVVGAGCWYHLLAWEWCLIIVAIALVLMAEALNTAIEYLCDAVSPEYHPLIGKSKDIAAGAVMLSAIAAAIIGLVVFGPRWW